MKIQSTSVLMGLAVLTLPAFADIFVLKDGTTIEGTTLKQDETSYVVEIQVTSSIKDERVIAKADVEKIKESKPDLVAFEAISGLVPVPDALTAEDYDERIGVVEKFIKDYGKSSKLEKAREILATLKSEANEILAGGVKFNGKIIPQPEYSANAYDIDSRIDAAKIKNLVDQARYLEALRAFSKFEKDFANTSAYAELVPLINRVIRSYIGSVSQSIDSFDARTKQRQLGLERMSIEDRRVSERAIAEENAAVERRFEAEKTAKVGWVTTHPYFKRSLEETVNFGKQELSRLDKQSTAPAVDGGEIFRDTLSLIQSKGEQSAVTASLAAARNAQIPQRYIDMLEAAAKSGGYSL